MSKTLSYRGQLAPTTQEKIKLSTINGKTGYRIIKFQTLSATPGAGAAIEGVVKIYKTNQSASIGPDVNFTEGDLLAVSYYQDNSSSSYVSSEDIIFDNEVFNQDIFITCSDANSGTVPMNFYIELETFSLTDIEATKLTLQSIRNLA